jgi:hemerythrin-like domain-containing protein
MNHAALNTIRNEHAALSAMVRSLSMMVERGPGPDPRSYFEVLRAMLFYLDEFPERLHHPKETELLFPAVARGAPETAEAIARLDADHERSERAVPDLLHKLVAWELLGEPRRAAFELALQRHIDFYLEHMLLEETVVLPAAEQVLTAAEWEALDEAFGRNQDPLTGRFPPTGPYTRLFSTILNKAPAPIGVGAP